MRIWVMVMGVFAATAALSGQTAPPPPEGSAQIAAVQALLSLDPARAWRTDAWSEGGELVLRVTATDPSGELRRVRAVQTMAVEARATLDAGGALERLTVRDTQRAGIRVRRTATAADRTAALEGARYAPARRAALVEAARTRSWAALGADAAVTDAPELAWRPVPGDRHRAVWQARVTVVRDGARVPFVASLDPADGSLVELVREVTR